MTPLLAGALAALFSLCAGRAVDVVSTTTTQLDVRTDCGATGDGHADDTAAFQKCADTVTSGGAASSIFIPPGVYLLTSTVHFEFANPTPMTLRGAGPTSNVLWAAAQPLFVFNASSPLTDVLVGWFAVSSVGPPKGSAAAALAFPPGVVKSTFDSLVFLGAGAVPNTTQTAALLGTCLDLGAVTDTVGVVNTLMWFLEGTGVRIGRGSEVRILGGRIIGPALRNDSSIGVHVTGNNGGVHITTTDVIGLGTGVLLDNSSGAGSNREIFLAHATLDSDGIGLHIMDNSYVSVAGCWAASSDRANIRLAPGALGAQLVVAGGTIFNGGTYFGAGDVGDNVCSSGDMCNGLEVHAGVFTLTGVEVRNNRGVGVKVDGAVGGFVMGSCRVFGNGHGVDLGGVGGGYVVSGCVFEGNLHGNNFGSKGGGAVVSGNVVHDGVQS